MILIICFCNGTPKLVCLKIIVFIFNFFFYLNEILFSIKKKLLYSMIIDKNNLIGN